MQKRANYYGQYSMPRFCVIFYCITQLQQVLRVLSKYTPHIVVLSIMMYADVGYAASHDSTGRNEQEIHTKTPSDFDDSSDDKRYVQSKGTLPANPDQIEFERQWNTYVGFAPSFRDYRWRPAQDNTMIYTIGKQGVIYAINKQNGERVLLYQLDTNISAGVTLVGDRLLFGTTDGELVAYNLRSGHIDWRVALYAETLHPPVSDGNVVLSKTNDGQLRSINIETGAINWTMITKNPPLTTRSLSEPLIEAGAIFSAFETGKIAIVHPRNGARVWEASLAGVQSDTEIDKLTDIDAAPVIVSRQLFVAGLHSSVQSFLLASNVQPQLQWSVDFSTHQNFVAHNSYLYLVNDNDVITALDQKDGALYWKNSVLSSRMLTAPILWDDILFVADGDGYIFAFSPTTGDLQGYKRVSPAAIQTYLIHDSQHVYVLDNSGFMSAYSIVSN